MEHAVLKPSFSRTDERGAFHEVLNDGTWQSLITGAMQPGAVLGDHYHKLTRIFFFITKGSVSIKTVHVETGARDEFALGSNEGVFLAVNESHAIKFMEQSEFIMLKSLRYDPDAPDTYHFSVED
jgi:dTDP-4-dehydrorhamnose 3,5-epimerase-like enzyme